MFEKLLDFNDPFFRPLWLRIVIVAFAAGWAVFEFVAGSPFWGVIFAAMAAFAFRGFFMTFAPRNRDREDNRE